MRKKTKTSTLDNKAELLELWNKFESHQTVKKGDSIGAVQSKFITPGGLPQIWVRWESGSIFPEMPDKLQVVEDFSKGLNQIDPHSIGSNPDLEEEEFYLAQHAGIDISKGLNQQVDNCSENISKGLNATVNINSELTQIESEIVKYLEGKKAVSDINIAMNTGLTAFQVQKALKFLRTKKIVSSEGNSKWSLSKSISVQELVLDSPLQELLQEDLNSSDSQKLTNIVQISSPNDSQVLPITEMCDRSEPQKISTSLQVVHLASLSQSKEKDREQTMSEIVSPRSLKISQQYDRSILQSKMSPDLYLAHTDQVWGKEPISGIWSGSYPNSATMRNGKLLAQDTLQAPGLDKDYFWLESPAALSSTGKGRPPGLTRLENQLKFLGLLQRGECANPAWLEKHYRIPINWTSPSESRTATQLLEADALRSEMPLIQELQRSHSNEFSTSISCPNCKQQLKFVDSRADCKCYQWFLTIPFYDQQTWGDEPFDPDDLWHVEERVRWHKTGREGIVKGLEQREILGAKLNYVLVQWNDAPSQVLIEPEKLWRIKEVSQPLIERTELNPLENVSVDICDRTQLKLNPLETTEHPPLKGDKGAAGKRRGARGKQHQSGSLYPYTSDRKLKNGIIASYPRVEGERDPDNPDHWYWGYCYEENVKGEWKNRSLPVPKYRVATVREMIARGANVEVIKALIKGEFSND